MTRDSAALSGLNFFQAAAETGFGAFLAVYLTEQKWTQTSVGVALSIGTVPRWSRSCRAACWSMQCIPGERRLPQRSGCSGAVH